MILIDNKEGLIGDFLGTIPAMQKLSENELVFVRVHPEAKELFELIRSKRLIDDYVSNAVIEMCKKVTLSSSEAFQIASKKSYYMSQAYMEQAGLEVPEVAPKANLSFKEWENVTKCDYILSPFAKSLPPDQKWPREKWQQLVDNLPDKKFVMIGSASDDSTFIHGKNVIVELNHPFDYICNLFKYSKGLISVVTGTSHLAFHLGVKNILLSNQQMTWGNQPDAIRINKHIPDITVNEVIEKL